MDRLRAQMRRNVSGRPSQDDVRRDLWGSRPNARGAEARELWNACAKDHAKPGDPRARRIRALIEAERAALAEEQELFARRQALNMDEPDDGNGVRALGKTWLAAVGAIERLDRQINAKVRLLIRLRAEEAMDDGCSGDAANGSGDAANGSGEQRLMGPPAVADKDRRPEAAATETTIAGTKPSKPLESTKPADEAGETGAEPTKLAEPAGPAAPMGD